MKIVDTHCHVQMSQYDSDRNEMLSRARDAGVGMICIGVDRESSKQAIHLAEEHDDIWATVGLHPNDNLDEVYDGSEYEKLAEHPRVVAIGEIGLDYYRTKEESKKQYQKDRFLEQLNLVKKTGKPVVLHCRDAHEDMLEILHGVKLSGVVHSFNGTTEQAQAYIKRGLYIGLNAIITFSAAYEEMVRSIPSNRIVLETDAPFLAPAPHRGHRNEPVYILRTLQFVARLKGVSEADFTRELRENVKRLFSI